MELTKRYRKSVVFVKVGGCDLLRRYKASALKMKTAQNGWRLKKRVGIGANGITFVDPTDLWYENKQALNKKSELHDLTGDKTNGICCAHPKANALKMKTA
ncbi:hypothetical protein [Flavobacterium caeni]|uniref:hypothetical protein n=1 Tax=Flavobacterium caeni TaxID=490189 RepID=UPI000B86A9B7|nr:hypothetical protein [Flavobacterium caeni]